MSAPPYMKLYVADYLGDTHHLSAIEHGAYMLLLMGMWRAGGSLPAADANLYRLARCTPDEWETVRAAILPFFKRSRGRLTHKRIASEMAKYETVSRHRSEAGKAGAAKKARKDSEVDQANAVVLPTKPEPEPEPKIREANASLSIARTGPTATEIARGFVLFWTEYPKRVGKDAAAKSFANAMRRAGGSDPLETIMDGLRRALPGWDDPQYIPNPTTWLNQGRWEDDAPSPRTGIRHDRPANDIRAEARSVWSDIIADSDGPRTGPTEPLRIAG